MDGTVESRSVKTAWQIKHVPTVVCRLDVCVAKEETNALDNDTFEATFWIVTCWVLIRVFKLLMSADTLAFRSLSFVFSTLLLLSMR